MDTVFTLAAGVLAIALVLVFFLPELPLRSMSGLQAQAAQQAAAEQAAEQATASAAAGAPQAAAGVSQTATAEPARAPLVGRVNGRVDGQAATPYATEPAQAVAAASHTASAHHLRVAARTHPTVEEAMPLEREMQAADPSAPPDLATDIGGLNSSVTELRQAVDELRLRLDEKPPTRTRRRRWPWLVAGVLVLALAAGVAVWQGALDRFDNAPPRRSTMTQAALPQTGPAIGMPGTEVTVAFGGGQSGDTTEVYEQAVLAAPGLDALALSQPDLTSLSGDVAGLKPQVSDIQVALDGRAARAVPAGAGTWVVVPPQGGRFTRAQLHYSVTGAVARSTQSLPGRAMVVVTPLTGSQALRAGLPLSVRFTSAAVQGVSCPTAPLADSLCAVDSGDTWIALLPSSATSPIVLAQVNLTPPH